MDGIEKFAVFGRYWQLAQAHVDIHSLYVGDCGATAPESRRKSAKTEKAHFDVLCETLSVSANVNRTNK